MKNSLSFFDLQEEQKDTFMQLANRVFNVSNLLKNNKNIALCKEQYSVLCAPAGTGKTYLLARFIDFCTKAGIKTTVLAFTGRAAGQLKKSGIPASTIHSLLFTPTIDEDGDLLRFDEKSLELLKAETGDIIIVDEGSMVPFKLHESLSKIGKPMIYSGDYDQLDPVDNSNKSFNPMTSLVDAFTLTKSRRFDDNSGIGRICAKLRESNILPRMGNGKDLKIIRKNMVIDLEFHKKNQYDAIICGTNKTRKRINGLVRAARGYDDEFPVKGEIVMCLKNDVVSHTPISNGELFVVEGSIIGKEKSRFFIKSLDVEDKKLTVYVHNETWTTEKMPEVGRNDETHYSVFTFGYAFSTWKAQGSGFDTVLYFDEDVSYFTDQRKFRYTGCSRAMSELTIAV